MDELPVLYTITTIFMPCNKDSNLCWTVFLLLAVLKGRLFFLTRYSACAFMCTMLLFLCCLFVHLFPYLRAKGPASPCTRTLEGTFTPYMLGFEIGVWSLFTVVSLISVGIERNEMPRDIKHLYLVTDLELWS